MASLSQWSYPANFKPRPLGEKKGLLTIDQLIKRGHMPYIRVIYRTKKYGFDYVPGDQLDALIGKDEITHFYRPSEEKWISVKFDPVRGNGGSYHGPERRRVDGRLNSKDSKERKGTGTTEVNSTDWLEVLWRDIER